MLKFFFFVYNYSPNTIPLRKTKQFIMNYSLKNIKKPECLQLKIRLFDV